MQENRMQSWRILNENAGGSGVKFKSEIEKVKKDIQQFMESNAGSLNDLFFKHEPHW